MHELASPWAQVVHAEAEHAGAFPQNWIGILFNERWCHVVRNIDVCVVMIVLAAVARRPGTPTGRAGGDRARPARAARSVAGSRSPGPAEDCGYWRMHRAAVGGA